jgi:hypothetical protein
MAKRALSALEPRVATDTMSLRQNRTLRRWIADFKEPRKTRNPRKKIWSTNRTNHTNEEGIQRSRAKDAQYFADPEFLFRVFRVFRGSHFEPFVWFVWFVDK